MAQPSSGHLPTASLPPAQQQQHAAQPLPQSLLPPQQQQQQAVAPPQPAVQPAAAAVKPQVLTTAKIQQVRGFVHQITIAVVLHLNSWRWRQLLIDAVLSRPST